MTCAVSLRNNVRTSEGNSTPYATSGTTEYCEGNEGSHVVGEQEREKTTVIVHSWRQVKLMRSTTHCMLVCEACGERVIVRCDSVVERPKTRRSVDQRPAASRGLFVALLHEGQPQLPPQGHAVSVE